MSLSPGQAAAALDEIERTERRTAVAGGYSAASPYLILWGAIWTLGYGACAVLPPERWGIVWVPLAIGGMLASAWLSVRTRAGRPGKSDSSAGAAVIGVAAFVFIGGAYYVFQPRSPMPMLVFPSFVAGLVYTVAGAVARMPRFVWIGFGILALTLAGYAAAPDLSAVWAAVAGGGGLLLGGLWLRRV